MTLGVAESSTQQSTRNMPSYPGILGRKPDYPITNSGLQLEMPHRRLDEFRQIVVAFLTCRSGEGCKLIILGSIEFPPARKASGPLQRNPTLLVAVFGSKHGLASKLFIES